jgi:hypothetical protein
MNSLKKNIIFSCLGQIFFVPLRTVSITAHSTQHTAHSTQHTAHSTQHTAHSTNYFYLLLVFSLFSFVDAQVFVKEENLFSIQPNTLTNLSSTQVVVKENTTLSNLELLSSSTLVVQNLSEQILEKNDVTFQPKKPATQNLPRVEIAKTKSIQKVKCLRIRRLSKPQVWIKNNTSSTNSTLLSFVSRSKKAVLSLYNTVLIKKIVDATTYFSLKYGKSIITIQKFSCYQLLLDAGKFLNKHYLRPPPFVG